MREILFRGKRTDNGEWVEGRLLAKNVIVPTGQHFFIEANFIYVDDLRGYEVDLETVGQFTGLYDKNGKKIFEGDILKYEEEYYLVKFLEYRWVAIYKTCLPDDLDQRTAKDFEKVGNIYDNPELLEG